MFGIKKSGASIEYLKDTIADIQAELDVANETIEKQSERLKERDETIKKLYIEIDERAKKIVQLDAKVVCMKEGLFSIQNDLSMLVENI